jgi:hypothetical protein
MAGLRKKSQGERVNVAAVTRPAASVAADFCNKIGTELTIRNVRFDVCLQGRSGHEPAGKIRRIGRK